MKEFKVNFLDADSSKFYLDINIQEKEDSRVTIDGESVDSYSVLSICSQSGQGKFNPANEYQRQLLDLWNEYHLNDMQSVNGSWILKLLPKDIDITIQGIINNIQSEELKRVGLGDWDNINDPKIIALAKFLEIGAEDAEDINHEIDNWYSLGGDWYRVCADKDEIFEEVTEYVNQNIWAFNASFLVDYIDDEDEIDEDMIKILQENCEGANEGLLDMVGNNLDDLVNAAIKVDGAGHFLNSYDGEEYESEGMFIYK